MPVVLSQRTSPDDTSDRGEQREAHARRKHKPRSQLCGKRRGEETEIRRKSRGTTNGNPDMKDSGRALPVLSLGEDATL